jgi:hypothetical protein
MAVEYSHHPQWLPKLMAGMKQPSIYMAGYDIALLTLKTIIINHYHSQINHYSSSITIIIIHHAYPLLIHY